MERMDRINLVKTYVAEDHRIFQEQLESQSTLNPGQILWHYTSGEGLLGILRSRTFWATATRYLNDSSEWQYACLLVDEVLEQITPKLSDRQRNVIAQTKRLLSGTNIEMFLCVTCFCEEGDLLSQWRAYGTMGAGYALGFDAALLARRFQCELRRIVYSKQEAQETIKQIVTNHLMVYDKYENGAEGNDIPGASFVLEDSLKEYMVRLKHPSFAEEREWRLVYPFWATFKGNTRDQLLFRVTAGRITPYVELPISFLIRKTDERPPLPLQSIRYGPVLTPHEQADALSLLLWHFEYMQGSVSVIGSDTPLRT